METLYWITRLDSLKNWICSVGTTSLVFGGILIFIYFIILKYLEMGCCEEANLKYKKLSRNWSSTLIPFGLLMLLGNIFIPSTKEAYVIYGVGGTIDYIKNDSVATQIPHKIIVAIDKYLEFDNESDNKQ